MKPNRQIPAPMAVLIALGSAHALTGCAADSTSSTNVAPSTTAGAPTTTASHTASAVPVTTSTAPVATGSTPTPPPGPPPGPRPSDAELAKLSKANNKFSFALWDKLGKTKGNLAISPFSIETAFAMTWLGAKANTAAQLKTALGFDGDAASSADIAGRYAKSLGGPLTISIVNRLFGEKTATFEKPFLDATQKDFGAALEPLDFKGATEASRLRINGWVAGETHDRIKDLIPSGGMSGDTRLALVNAIYFLGDWRETFSKEATGPAAFHTTATAQHDVPTMHDRMSVPFMEDDTVSVLDLPYQGGGFSMTFIVPKKVDGLDAVEAKLSAEGLGKWISAEKVTDLSIALPKFTINPAQPPDLGGALVSLGMSDAFDPSKADFTGIANPPNAADRLFIGAVFHKAFVKVDEKGTEAAAATAIVMAPAGAAPSPPAKSFVADRPFLFLLRDAASNTILFLGRVADPVAS